MRGIGFLQEYLDCFFTCNRACVRHFNADIISVRFCVICSGHIGIFKRSVRITITEGIGNGCVIIIVTCITNAHYLIFISGFGVSITGIDTFLIYDVAIFAAPASSDFIAVGIHINIAGISIQTAFIGGF